MAVSLYQPHQGQSAQHAAFDQLRRLSAVDRAGRVRHFDLRGEFAEPRGAGQSIRRAGAGHSALQSEFGFQPLRQLQAQQRLSGRHAGQQAQQSHNS